MPKVSVIIPTYNRCGMIGETLGNVLSQTERDLEVILVDDGSSDDTDRVVRECADGRVSYYYKSNGGASSARNFGLARASGRYTAFLDSDDSWPENYLEVMLSCLDREGDFGAAYSPITVVYPGGPVIRSYKKPEGKRGWIALDLFRKSFIWPSAALFRSSVWKDFYFDESLKRTSEDSDAFLRLALKTRFTFVPDVEAFHRISPDSISVAEGVACTRILVLERFYYHLGGNRVVPARVARRRISHACRKVAEDRRRKGARTAALVLYRRAIRYWPGDLRLYWGLLRALLLDGGNDGEAGWRMPAPLGDPVGPNRFR